MWSSWQGQAGREVVMKPGMVPAWMRMYFDDVLVCVPLGRAKIWDNSSGHACCHL